MSFGAFVSGYVPMLRLGTFNFALNVAVYQQMHRTAEYRWPSMERFGQLPALQYTGPGDEVITLPGIIFPEWRGSANAMGMLRDLAEQGQPLLMLDAHGRIYGRWVIRNVEETRSTYSTFNMPRKIEFSVTIQKFDGADINKLAEFVNDQLSTVLQ